MTKRDLGASLLKIAEECGELTQMCFKCIFYGMDNTSPKNGNTKTNREKLIEEIGDLMANVKLLIDDTDAGITFKAIYDRAVAKYKRLENYIPEAK